MTGLLRQFHQGIEQRTVVGAAQPGQAQALEGVFGVAHRIAHQRQQQGVLRHFRPQFGGVFKFGQGPGQLLLADESQAQGVVQGRLVVGFLQAFAQHLFAAGLVALGAQQVGAVGPRHGRRGVAGQGGGKARVGFPRLALRHGQRAQVELALGAVGVDAFGGARLGQGLVQRGLAGGGQLAGQRRQSAGGREAHHLGRIGQRRHAQGGGGFRRQEVEGAGGIGTHEGVGVGEPGAHGGVQARHFGGVGGVLREQAQGGGAGDARLRAVLRQLGQHAAGLRHAGAPGAQGVGERRARGLAAVPLQDLRRRPRGVLPRLGVAGGAAVGGDVGAPLGGEVRARHAEAVVVALVHTHVGVPGHVAGRALGAGGTGRVAVVRGRIKLGRQVALRAQHVAGQHALAGVRVVAVGAGDPGVAHAALGEGAPFVHLVLDFAGAAVQVFFQEGGAAGFAQGRGRVGFFIEHIGAGVAAHAGVDQGGRRRRALALGDAGGRVHHPPFLAVNDRLREAAGGVGGLGLRPLQVALRRAVAGLAGQRHLRPGGAEGIGFFVVTFFERGGVARGAHVVPVLHRPGPEQRIAGGHLVVTVEVEPALAAVFFVAGVVGQRQALQPAAGEMHQILLQGEMAEGVGHFVAHRFALRALRGHEVAAAFCFEGRGDAQVGKRGVVEVALDGLRRWQGHGLVVVGLRELLRFQRMAGGAGGAARVACAR